MKVLHSTFILNSVPGILNQMRWEHLAAREKGLDWDTKLFCADARLPPNEITMQARSVTDHASGKTYRRALNWLKLRREYYEWLGNQAAHYDVILLRHSRSDPMQDAFIKKLQLPVFSIHHDLEIYELRSSDQLPANSIRANLEQFFGKKTLRSVRGIIGVTDEILRYERSRIRDQTKLGYVYPNGVFYSETTEKHVVDERGSVPEILFVASHFVNWHGLDLLFDSTEKSGSKFILHLVGRLNSADRSRALHDSRIKMHGVLSSSDVDEISQKCWLGLSSFALHRKNMKQACTLKVREYLMNGLPVYAGYQDVFPDDFDFYRKGPPEIENILDYAGSIRNSTRLDVAQQAKPFISKAALLSDLYDWLKKNTNTDIGA